ncbi:MULTISPECIES: imidazole glycerol phosphate synthase subunit HisH [unclassified Thalassospira]|uniref:imidazole glycerol phosphate synthase subunit HisH n=1 Tax=unclassified Thalassospira TaxID=2648997 RepID=UPI001B188CE8|nr:imidazole glycerol phosphate synthase subunit HisH [Thalassospira sp.]MBO6769760.1 imidazole glycerol phosphate synthase subunit HisH [Thalassospira sp.]
MKYVIVNTGVGNVRSVANMLKRAKVVATISDDPKVMESADAILLPGVGSYDAAIRRFKSAGIVDVLNEHALVKNTPILGICLGMQLLASGSEEGNEPGFGWIPGELKRIPKVGVEGVPVRVPHMGWNIIEQFENNVLYDNMGSEPRFYFDHSYCFIAERDDYYCGSVVHGVRFAAGIRKGNIFGVQFHPEKSHRFGLALFENFVRFVDKHNSVTIGC